MNLYISAHNNTNMLASLLQLIGSVLLVIMTVSRKSNRIHMYGGGAIVQQIGKVSLQLKPLLFETYIFRLGLFYIAVGYLIQIANFDLSYFKSLSVSERLILTAIITVFCSWLSKKLCDWLAAYRFKKLPPFDPDRGEHAEGSLWIEN